MAVINSTYVANTLQPHFSKKLLAHAVQETRLIEFAQLEALTPQSGSKEIKFFRPEVANLAAEGAPAVLVEGTAPAQHRGITYEEVGATLVQVGQTSKTTDVADNIGLFRYLDNAKTLMGEEFALDVETRMRNPLCHPTTGLTKRYTSGSTTFAQLQALSLANGSLKPVDVLDSMTQLKLARAPKIQGWYVAYVCPQTSRDIMNNAEWREVVKHNNAAKIFKGEIGEWSGCKFVEGTVPFQEDETEGTHTDTFNGAGTNTTGLIYTNFILGHGAFGSVDMKKLGSAPAAKRPQIIVNDKADKSDPLNQSIVIGWKAFYAAIVLQRKWGIALRCKSQYVAA
jgi:N4-gp56 family major capsid protein